MLNVESVVSNQSPINFSDFSFGQYQAVFLVFSPKIIPTQVLRPYQYNFNNAVVDDIIATTMQRGGNNFSPVTGAMYEAIIPTPNGIPLNLSQYSEYWSGVLMIDTQQVSRPSLNAMPGPARRQICVGFFPGEPPINPVTMYSSKPTSNPNAIFVITHSTMIMVGGRLNPILGNKPITTVTQDVDTVPQMLAQLTPVEPYLMTLDNLRTCATSIGNGEDVVLDGPAAVAANEKGATIIESRAKSPKQQLNDIMSCMSEAVSYIGAADDAPRSMMNARSLEDPSTNFVSTFDASVSSNNAYTRIASSGVDPSRPITVGELDLMYPGMLMTPYKIPQTSQWDVRDQMYTTRSTVMSSMVSATVGTAATNNNLTEIGFRYMSHGPGGARRLWEILKADTIIPATQETILNCVKMFQFELSNSLFPALLQLNGPFNLIVMYNQTGDCLVDLQFLDDASEGPGFIETCNRMGGLYNPLVGDQNLVINNAIQLNTLVNTAGMQLTNTPQKSLSLF